MWESVLIERRDLAPTFDAVECVAGVALDAGSPVYVQSGLCYPASALDGRFHGFCISVNVQAGGKLGLLPSGNITMPDWSIITGAPGLSAGKLYFLSEPGKLSIISADLVGYCVQVAAALDEQTLNVGLRQKVKL